MSDAAAAAAAGTFTSIWTVDWSPAPTAVLWIGQRREHMQNEQFFSTLSKPMLRELRFVFCVLCGCVYAVLCCELDGGGQTYHINMNCLNNIQ